MLAIKTHLFALAAVLVPIFVTLPPTSTTSAGPAPVTPISDDPDPDDCSYTCTPSLSPQTVIGSGWSVIIGPSSTIPGFHKQFFCETCFPCDGLIYVDFDGGIFNNDKWSWHAGGNWQEGSGDTNGRFWLHTDCDSPNLGSFTGYYAGPNGTMVWGLHVDLYCIC